jgi:SAM-dependent methyltransferase
LETLVAELKKDGREIGMIFGRKSKAPAPAEAPPAADLIRVEDLIGAYDSATHVARADAYFKGAEANPFFWRKPFNDAAGASELMRNFSEILAHLDLYNGIDLMDFGAGTCWSSRLFAYMGCSVTAVDVSVNALRAGEHILGADPLRAELDIRFLAYDGETIGLGDESMDRIVCLDCFHHVADPASALAEFHRILRPGGVIAFSEPGPHHSLSSTSQYEMRTHGVIENDIVIADIWRIAQSLGFSDIKLSHATLPRLFDPATFDQLISASTPSKLAAAYLASDAPRQSNKRCFFLYKAGAGQQICDSRTSAGLAAAITITAERKDGVLVGSARLDNIGQARWLTQDGLRLGQVRLGAHHFSADGRLADLDYARFELGHEPVEPGQSRVVTFELSVPPSGGFLDIDLVAEGVIWFETAGSKPVRLGPFDPA